MEPWDYVTRLAAYAVIVDPDEQILLTWYRGSPTTTPGWSLPGGGVEYDETLEQAVVREVSEESGYDVVVGDPVATHSFTGPGTRQPKPFKSLRVIFDATIVGGTLGTLEVGGTTERAAWVPVADLETGTGEGAVHRSDIVDVAVATWRRRTG